MENKDGKVIVTYTPDNTELSKSFTLQWEVSYAKIIVDVEIIIADVFYSDDTTNINTDELATLYANRMREVELNISWRSLYEYPNLAIVFSDKWIFIYSFCFLCLQHMVMTRSPRRSMRVSATRGVSFSN